MNVRQCNLGLVAACLVVAWSLQDLPVLHAQSPPANTDTAKLKVVDRPSSTNPVSDKASTSGLAGAAQKPGVDRSSIVQLLVQANPLLWPLVACSIFTLGYVLERALALRRERVIPREFAERFLERLSAGKLDRERALELCRAHDSPVARVFAMVVNVWGQPGVTIRQILSNDAAGEVVELKRNLRVLSAMSTLGPLLGLLGTVWGIIQSFDALGGRVGPSRGEALAHGISLALVATAIGLAIAIVSVAFYYFFLNRVDLLVRELDDRTRQVIELVCSEAQRHSPQDRRHIPLSPPEPLRQDSRVL